MKKIQSIILLVLTTNLTYGEISIDQKFINDIDLGYTTRWDIVQRLGQGEYLEKKILNPENERDLGQNGWVHSNGLYYLNKGLIFKCYNDGELISGIQFKKPYRGVFGSTDTLIIGQTKLEIAFPEIDTFKVSTTGASYYWSFQFDGFTYYIEKPNDHKNKIHFSEVPHFKDNLEYYKSQPISIVTKDLYNYDLFQNDLTTKNENLLCVKPIYAPKDNEHLNCCEMGWPNNISWFFIPFYALTGGRKSEQIKQGYWQVYSPRHLISYEGEFKDGRENGVFKYYDINGELESTKNHTSFFWMWVYILAIGLVIILIIWKLKNRKRHITISLF